MAAKGNAQVTIDVSARLQIMQSSLEEMKKILDGLVPDSTGYNKINKLIQEMTKQMEGFQAQSERAFSSKQQFTKANKSIEKMEETLIRINHAVGELNFSDLKLTPEQSKTLEQYNKEIQKIKQNYEELKNTIKDEILSKGNNLDILKSVDANLISKNFDTIISRLEKEIENFNRKVYTSMQEAQQAVALNTKFENLTSTGISADSLGTEMFQKYFQITKNNVIRFATSGFKAGEVKTKFLEALRQEFQLTPEDINKITSALPQNWTFSNLNDLFTKQGSTLLSNVSNRLLKNVDTTTRSERGNVEHLRQVNELYKQFSDQIARDANGNAIGEIAKKQDEVTSATEKNTQSLKENQQQILEKARTDKTAANSSSELKSQLELLNSELKRSSAEFMRIQSVQRTFNSIKMAITNFMGFTQVLNLTKRAVKEAMNHIKQLDTTMNGIAIVTNMTTADLWKQIDAYSEIAQRYGTTIQGAYEVSKIYYQAGYETNDVLTMMNETLKLSKISGMDFAKATDYMMTAVRGFHMETSEAAKVVDVYSALAANTAVSQEELATAMSKTASSMEGVGSTFEETSAMIATMVAVTRESATNIGTALKSIASRLILLGA